MDRLATVVRTLFWVFLLGCFAYQARVHPAETAQSVARFGEQLSTLLPIIVCVGCGGFGAFILYRIGKNWRDEYAKPKSRRERTLDLVAFFMLASAGISFVFMGIALLPTG